MIDKKTVHFSICATNFNCASTIEEHLQSIYSLFDYKNFEYIVVDSFSTDNSIHIFRKYQAKYGNIRIFQYKCKRGKGRNIAVSKSKTDFIIVVDTDTSYFPIFPRFIYTYLDNPHYHKYGIRAIYAGIYTKKIIEEVGGWSDIQSDDWDMTLKIHKKTAKARVLPLIMGKNIKEQYASGDRDFLSNRYSPLNKISRFINSEQEKLRLSLQLKHLNLEKISKSLEIDMDLGKNNINYMSNPVRYQSVTKYLKMLLLKIGMLFFIIFCNIFKIDSNKIMKRIIHSRKKNHMHAQKS